MKVLIVKASALGDIMHALPALSYLKSAVPQMEIDWLAEERFASLLEGHPLIRKVHSVRTREWRRQRNRRSLDEIIELKRALRREEYAVALDLQGNCKSALFTLFSGASLRYGFDRAAVREWPNLFATNRRVGIDGALRHITDRMLAVARSAFPGGSASLSAGPLSVKEDALLRVDRYLQKSGLAWNALVVIHCGGTWKTKRWLPEFWRKLSRALGQMPGLRLVLTWGSDEELAVARGIQEVCAAAVVWPRGTLSELVALLSRAELVVGGDTGPIHIAAAVGTPTVSLFRATDGHRNAPRGGHHHFIQAPMGCSPCLRKECPKDRECAESIGVCAVLNSISLRLARTVRMKVCAHA